jgi:hypothetical protein
VHYRVAGVILRTDCACARQSGFGVNPMVCNEKTMYRPVPVKGWQFHRE